MAVLCLPVFLLFVTDTFAAVCLRLIAGLKPHNLLGSQPALQCAVRFTIQVQNLTIKYQNTAYLEKIVDFILLFLLHLKPPHKQSTAARCFAANPPKRIHPHKLIRDMNHQYEHARGKRKHRSYAPCVSREGAGSTMKKSETGRIKLSTAKEEQNWNETTRIPFSSPSFTKRESHRAV